MSFEVISLNARRLLTDAELLASNGKYRSAVALCVLSLEESAKACFLKWEQINLVERHRLNLLMQSHVKKQSLLVSFRAADAAVKTIIQHDKYLAEANLSLPVFNNTKELRVSVAQAIMENSWSHEAIINSEMLNYLKQWGFYTDVDAKSEIFDSGLFNDAHWFCVVEGMAREGIDMASASEPIQRAMVAIHEVKLSRPTRRKSEREVLAKWARAASEAVAKL